MQSRLDRARGDPEPPRDVVDRQVRPEPEDDDGALVGGEDIERSERCVGLDDCRERVRRHRSVTGAVDRDEADDSPSAKAIPAGIDDDSIEPRLELRLVAELTDRTVGSLEGVADRILGLGRGTQDEARESKGTVELGSRQLRKPLRWGPPVSLQDPLRVAAAVNRWRSSPIQTSEATVSFSGSRLTFSGHGDAKRPAGFAPGDSGRFPSC